MALWNQLNTGDYEGMIAETITVPGTARGDVRMYYSRPLGVESYPGIVLIPHMPGWDEWCRETARRFTQHGYAVLCPDIYSAFGTGTPSEVSARTREQGGVSDASVMEDCRLALNTLKAQPQSNGKVGVIGMCSGGRHAYLAACTVDGFDAAVDCWGGRVVMAPETLTPAQPVAPIDCTESLNCPLLGIFGNDDQFPSPAEVDQLEAELKKFGKDYEFHRYDGAGHGMWYYHNQMYRQEQAMDGWDKTLAFFDKNLK